MLRTCWLAALATVCAATHVNWWGHHEVTDAPAQLPVPTAVMPLSVNGTHTVDATGKRVKLSCASWPGAEEKLFVPMGLEWKTIDGIADLMVDWGLNCVQMPFSLEMVATNPVIDQANLVAMEPQLLNATALDVFSAVVEKLTRKGMMVILVNYVSAASHCCRATDGNGLWYSDEYPEERWLDLWEVMVRRHMDNPMVVGADLRNELRADDVGGVRVTPTWGSGDVATDWRLASIRAMDRLQALAPHLLMLVQGIDLAQNLTGVRDHPILDSDTLISNKRVYVSHFGYSSRYNTRESVVDLIEASWGYIFIDANASYAAPVLLGEFEFKHFAYFLDTPYWVHLQPWLAFHDLPWGYYSVAGTNSGGPGEPYGYEHWTGLLNEAYTAPVLPYFVAQLGALVDQGYWKRAPAPVPVPTTPAPVKAVARHPSMVAYFDFDGDVADGVNTSLAALSLEASRFTEWASTPAAGKLYHDQYLADVNPVAPQFGSSPNAVSGQALYLDGTYGLRFPPGLLNSSEYTIAFWVKPARLSILTPAVFFGSEFESLNVMPSHFAGRMAVQTKSAGRTSTRDTRLFVPLFQWTHFAVAVKDGEMTFMQNGVAVFRSTGIPDFFVNPPADFLFTLGLNRVDKPFNGWFDDFALFSKALLPDEVDVLLVEKTSEAVLADRALAALCIAEAVGQTVSGTLTLPNTTLLGMGVVWTSSDESVLTSTGVVAPPLDPVPVVLTATVALLDGSSASRTFELFAVSTPPPSAAYTFDCKSLADRTGSSEDVQTIGSGVTFVDGVHGDGLSFDGASGIELPANLTTGDSYTVSVWLKPAVGSFGSSWCSILPQAKTWKSAFKCGRTWFHSFAPAAFHTRVRTNKWTHVAVSVCDGVASLHLNGKYKKRRSYRLPSLFTGNATIPVGATPSGETLFEGSVDELLFFDQPLSSRDIRAVHNPAAPTKSRWGRGGRHGRHHH